MRMGKSKDQGGKGKGKAVASSSNAHAQRAPKRRLLAPRDEEEDVPLPNDPPIKHTIGKGRLSQYDMHLQIRFFNEKIN
ncbi:hypothetical protein E3N88_30703 [Mikania micrantha]|uniref:Uncharacterized protein n=1 Tax=Mikania micrantha TaxID=192012 RepID=A0A5N6MNC1_9ASTR|nr:hypothetical protein E3N88_30703 [Mikania micrantha]